MIPKVIHYCWFGGNPLPELAQMCIASWKKYCPDYEIKEWNESNVDIHSIDYMREAYEEKAWGFVPDVARLQIIYEQGGIYLDTDVEIIKPFDDLLNNSAFMGIEDKKFVALGLGFGAEKGHPFVKELLDEYRIVHYRNPDGQINKIPAPMLQKQIFVSKGFREKDIMQTLCDTVIYPSEYFCPMSPYTGKLHITEHTCSIHHYSALWRSESERELSSIRRRIFKKWHILAAPIWFFTHIYLEIKQHGIVACFHKAAKKYWKKEKGY